MKEPRPGAWHGGLWLQASKRWNKMEWSGVRVAFETCETSVLLAWCSRVGPVHLSKNLLKWDGSKMNRYEKWDGGGCSDTCKAREKLWSIPIQVSNNILFWRTSPWLWLVILASNFCWWTWLYVSVADRLVSSEFLHGLVWHRFCPQALAEALKVNKTVTDINLGYSAIGKEGAKAWWLARGSVAPGLETVK